MTKYVYLEYSERKLNKQMRELSDQKLLKKCKALYASILELKKLCVGDNYCTCGGMAIQDKIDITHLNAIDPIKRHIVITIFIFVFMRLVLCASNCLHGSKLAA